MPNKRFSDVNPSRGDKDSSKESLKGGAPGKPGNPSQSSFKAPGSANPPCVKEKGGKALPVPKFVGLKNRADEATGKLPKGI